VLVSILNTTKDQEVQTACCLALGQIADPGGMEPLIRILIQKGRMFLKKKHSDGVRAAAAAALAQIRHPRAAELFKSLSEDRDPRIRQTVRNLLKEKSTMDTKNKTV
jgi:HEAT repeat protein